MDASRLERMNVRHEEDSAVGHIPLDAQLPTDMSPVYQDVGDDAARKRKRRRPRKPNWSQDEKETLLQVVLEHMPQIPGSAVTWDDVVVKLHERRMVQEKLESPSCTRTTEECRQALRNMRKMVRRAMVEQQTSGIVEGNPEFLTIRNLLIEIQKKEDVLLRVPSGLDDKDDPSLSRSKRRRDEIQTWGSREKRRKSEETGQFLMELLERVESLTVALREREERQRIILERLQHVLQAMEAEKIEKKG